MGDAVGMGDAGVGAGGTGVGSGGAEVGSGTDVGDGPGSPHPQPLAEKPTNITTKSNGLSFFIEFQRRKPPISNRGRKPLLLS